MKKQAFTLVELIVVITILAILGTIAFLSFQGYSSNARDSVRIGDLNNISRGMEFMLTKTGRVPVPDDSVEITASGTVILHQGYAGENVLGVIGVNNGGKDPKDDTFYTYSSNTVYNKYQLLGFLEDGDEISLNTISGVNADLSNRYPLLEGDELGIVTDSVTKEPIQLTGTGVDIALTNQELKVYIDSASVMVGTGELLKNVQDIVSYGNVSSCSDLLNKNDYLKNKDGYYTIFADLNVPEEVYCDMTSVDGPWMREMHLAKPDFLNACEKWENGVFTTCWSHSMVDGPGGLTSWSLVNLEEGEYRISHITKNNSAVDYVCTPELGGKQRIESTDENNYSFDFSYTYTPFDTVVENNFILEESGEFDIWIWQEGGNYTAGVCDDNSALKEIYLWKK